MKYSNWTCSVLMALAVFGVGLSSPAMAAAKNAEGSATVSTARITTHGIIGIGGDGSNGGEGIIGIGGDGSNGGEGIIGIGGDGSNGGESTHLSIGMSSADKRLVVGGTLFETGDRTVPRGRTVIVRGTRSVAGLTGRVMSAQSVFPLAGTVAEDRTVNGIPVSIMRETVGGSAFVVGGRVALSGYFTGAGFIATRVEPAQFDRLSADAFAGSTVVMADDPLRGLAPGSTVSADLWLTPGSGPVTAYGIVFDLSGAERFGHGAGLYRLEGRVRNGTVVVGAAYPAD